MKKIGFLAGIGLLLLISSGVFSKLVEFAVWFFMLQYTGPSISIFGEIVVRLLTFVVTFSLVGITFESLGWFNSKVMHIVYCIVSTIVSFILAYVIWTIEEHLLIIGIVLGIICVLIIAVFVVRAIISRRKNKSKEQQS